MTQVFIEQKQKHMSIGVYPRERKVRVHTKSSVLILVAALFVTAQSL